MNKIINELITTYNIKEADIFLQLVRKALIGEIEAKEVGYNLHLVLGMDLNSAVELAARIQFLSDKDKSEILKDLEQEIKQKIDINLEIKSILSQKSIFVPAELNNRLAKLTISYLQDIRDEMEFKDALLRSPKIGGLGLTAQEADNLINSLKIKKAEWQKAGINLKAPTISGQIQESDIDVAAKVSPPPVLPVAPAEITIDQILEQRAKATAKPAPITQPNQQMPPGIPFVEEIEEEEKFLESKEELPSPQEPIAPPMPQPVAPAPTKQPLIKPTDQLPSRPQISDIKFDQQLYGPVDELAAMSLNDFRRLSKDPNQSIQKIKEKLDILEGESIMRRNEGIKALKSSPLYKIYAEIMNQALIQGKSFEQIIAERNDINLAEFKAIMELNKSLKY